MLLWLGWSAAAAQGAHPFGVPESGGAGGPGWLSGVFGQVAVWQSHFYRQLTGAVRAWQQDGGAAWALVGLSFAYGVFHALGPGHGKAVISSYVLANRQTARNGALLALVSALVQALVAIAMVAVLALAFNATAALMNAATRWLELASYALVTALGAWLVWARAIRPLRARAATSAHVHAHAHDCGCGHAHAPEAASVAGPLDRRRAVSAVLAVGLRPCSGALIVLVFALSQGFFLAGVASALAMGAGTGLTVAALAMLAVAAGGAADRLGRRLSGASAARLRYGVQALAALAVLLLGVMLLGGALAAGG
nr:nickel/cobalt transporter [Achromobacter pulmonis]